MQVKFPYISQNASKKVFAGILQMPFLEYTGNSGLINLQRLFEQNPESATKF
jgi:hypothetical protein